MKIHKNIIIILSLLLLAGCASVPVREGISLKGPVYQIEGSAYVSLGNVINTYGLQYDWDSIAKKLKLYRGDEEAILAIGANVALVNNLPRLLSSPVRLYRNIIVIPKDFASTDLAGIFIKRYTPRAKVTAPLISIPSIYRVQKIVIDAGHGGKDPGAIGNNLREKDITLDVAKRLKDYLQDSGIKVILTRGDDRFISLWKRADIANKNKGDFFISVHANACRSKYPKGFEVYYLSEAIDDDARAVAAAENASLQYEDSSFGNRKPSSALEATLWDLENRENRLESKELADYIGNTACKKLGIKNRGTKFARFYVLKGARMPSVLIEMGFISNKQDAKNLKSNEYRQRLAQAIGSGVIAYKKKYETQEGFTK